MTTYSIKGSGTLTANSPKEIVEKLNEQSFNKKEKLMDFVRATSEACMLQDGKTVSKLNYTFFVNDLIKNEYLTKII